jgi:hypothetical protein
MRAWPKDPYGVSSRLYADGFTLSFEKGNTVAALDTIDTLRFERGWMSQFGPTEPDPAHTPARRRYHD